jgi:hypothetical protein
MVFLSFSLKLSKLNFQDVISHFSYDRGTKELRGGTKLFSLYFSNNSGNCILYILAHLLFDLFPLVFWYLICPSLSDLFFIGKTKNTIIITQNRTKVTQKLIQTPNKIGNIKYKLGNLHLVIISIIINHKTNNTSIVIS